MSPLDRLAPPAELIDIKVVDCDTHMTEPHDLWTSRAPRGYRDRVPQVVTVDDMPTWTFDGQLLGRASAASVVKADGTKLLGVYHGALGVDDAFPNHDVAARLDLMDRLGIWAQIVYPNVVGFGGERFGRTDDEDLRLLCVQIYNDAMAEVQERSGGRLFPMAYVPWWDMAAAVAEVERVKALGLRGVNTTSDPQEKGLPDLNDPSWDSLWEVCSDLDLPVNFHVVASDTVMTSWASSSTWPSFEMNDRMAIASSVMFLSNARVIANLIFAGIFERFPRLKVVSVESGVGWIPFLLQALDYQLREAAPETAQRLSLTPTEYFHRNMYSTFWFEADGPSSATTQMLEQVGTDNCLFSTDFPHITCYYPDGLHRTASSLSGATSELRTKVLSSNATQLYDLERR